MDWIESRLANMTAPAPVRTPPRTRVVGGGTEAPSAKASPFGGSTPPDHRTTALQSAVDILRAGKPAASAEDVLAMAEKFYDFLKKGN